MERQRGFEVISRYKDQQIQLPVRSTHFSAGYDIEAAERTVIPSLPRQLHALAQDETEQMDIIPTTLVPTGLKAYMQEDEYLQLINRSSNPMKRNLCLPNSVGIIDQDYYNNPNNEGHIFVQLVNYGPNDYIIEKGERICQGIFAKYYTTDQDSDHTHKAERSGGFGSTD